MSTPRSDETRSRFAELHASGTFVMPNVWDVGSALVLQSLGFEALATTSSGFAAALGRHDQNVTLAELTVHVKDICSAVEVPVSVDSEAGYAAKAEDLKRTVRQLATAGAAGVSIEDYLPGRGIIRPEEATDRVGIFADAAHEEGLTVTARAENHLYGVDDLDETITRLRAYRLAGADVVYAPGLVELDQIGCLADEVSAPINVLLLPDGPSVGELAEIGVRRISTGGALAFLAYGALATAGRELAERGTTGFTAGVLTPEERAAAFGDG